MMDDADCFETKNKIVYDTDSPAFLLWQLNTIWQDEKMKAINSISNLSPLQYMILVNLNWLISNGGEVTQIVLANHLNMEAMGISQALKILERKGYITRREHDTDTRAKLVWLSEYGKEVVAKAMQQVEQVETVFFQILGNRLPIFKEDMKKLIQTNII